MMFRKKNEEEADEGFEAIQRKDNERPARIAKVVSAIVDSVIEQRDDALRRYNEN